MREVEERLLEETDYELEVRRSIEFSIACKNLNNVVFPNITLTYPANVLLLWTGWKAKHLKEFLATNPSQELRDQIGQALWDFYNYQQHELRAVHADPHPGNFMITAEGKLGVIDFGCIKVMPDDFYYPFFSLTSTNLFDDKEETIKAFRKLEMILPNDTPVQIEFYHTMFKQMISLFAKPYITETFDFGEKAFFDDLFGFGEKVSKMPEFKQARGVKHFIYVNRTNFGLYNILHDLQARVKTGTYKPHVEALV
jgi:predicted unusual protein kinase regulating ubiquinone biosynthesis (AarF/ABC1/UbiB family)